MFGYASSLFSVLFPCLYHNFTIEVEYVDDSDGSALGFEYWVQPTTTIKELKAQIQSKKGVPAASQMLIFNSQKLSDDKTLAHYKIEEGSLVDLEKM